MSIMSMVQESGVKFTPAQFIGLLSVEGEGRRLLDRIGVDDDLMAAERDRPAGFAGPVVEWPAGVPGWVRDVTEKLTTAVALADGSVLAAIEADGIPSVIVFRADDDYAAFLVGPEQTVGLQCTARQVADLLSEYTRNAAASIVDWSVGWYADNRFRILKKTDEGMSMGVSEDDSIPTNAQEFLLPLFV